MRKATDEQIAYWRDWARKKYGYKPRLSLDDRIMQWVMVGFDGCWHWTGSDNGRGRPIIKADGKSRQVSRVIWERDRGPIPTGHHIHHSCENNRCVNIDHLECLSHDEHWEKHRAK